MKIKSIAEGAVIRLASDPSGRVLGVGDEVPANEAIRVENAPPWPQMAVVYEDDAGTLGMGDRIGGMVIG